MSDKALDSAIARRDALAVEINESLARVDALKREMRDVDTFIRQWKRFAGVETDADLFDVMDDMSAPNSPGPKQRNSKKEEVAEAARELIQAAGRPMSRTELYEALVKKGFVIRGTNPEMVLSTMLWRMRDRVGRLATGGYVLREHMITLAEAAQGGITEEMMEKYEGYAEE